MSTTDQFLLALQAYREVQAELHQDGQPLPVAPPVPSLESPATQAARLPAGTLLIGLADDGLPVLLDLYDPAPGPLLVAADGACGKTALLQSVARSSDLRDPGEVQFGVLTPFPEEWIGLEARSNCLGVWPVYHPSARQFLSQLVSWAEVLPETRQAVILLFDGLDLMNGSGFQFQHDLRWLLMYGPERQVWPLVTVNPARLSPVQNWLDYFHTRLIGQVKNAHNSQLLVGNPGIDLAGLLPGNQFVISQPDGCLKFWLPPLD